MLDPQTTQLVLMVGSLVVFVTFFVGVFYGLILLAKIRKQAVGINKRLDELLARTTPGRGNSRETGMSL